MPADRDAASLLDPLVVERRLFEIDVMSRTDFPTDKDYVRAIKSAIYRLRRDLVQTAKEAARDGR